MLALPLIEGLGILTGANMAFRPGSTSVKRTLWRSLNTSRRSTAGRQFTCTAIRNKDVASQDELPNLRHAQRPRETGHLPYPLNDC